MPTENRSSNTEMVSMPAAHDLAGKVREALDRQACPDAWMVIAYEAVVKSFPTPAPQPHPEPIAWMVGTAIWWTKEEAERDAAATGLPVVPVGPLSGGAEAEQLRDVIKHSDAQIMRQSMRISNQRAQLTAAHALLRDIELTMDAQEDSVSLGYDIELRMSNILRPSASAEHNQCDGCQAGIPLINGAHRMGKPGGYSDIMSCQAAKYASAEPSAPIEIDERAEFEADWSARHGVVTDVGARNSFYRLQPLGRYRWPDVQNAWDAWQARAALDRKPS